MRTTDRSVRMYRRLVALYPRSFREQYGAHMVFVFEEMLADLPTGRVWSRTVPDALSSIITQRLETYMSNKSMLRPLGFAALALAALVTVAAQGAQNLAVFFGAVTLTGLLALAALVYWQANRSYVEPSDELHRYWLRCLLAGAACIALVNLATAADVALPWLVLFTAVIFGAVLLAVGALLAVWHGVARLRSVRTA